VYGHTVFKRFKVTLLSPDYGMKDYLEGFLSDSELRYINTGSSMFSMVFSTLKELRSDYYKLVHSHGFTAALVIAPVCNAYRKPHLITAHDVFLASQFNGWRGAIKYLAMRWVLENSDRIHAVSVDGKENIRQFFPSIREEKIDVVLHGIDVETFSNASPAQLEFGPRQDRGDRFVFGFLGRFMAQKGFRVLVEAVNLIVKKDRANRSFCVATFGWGGFIREDYEYIEELGLGKYFCQLPETNDVASAIKALDAVVMPSRWEACGLLGMEVLTAGRPLIASRCIGLREVIQDTPALSFEVDDVE